MIYLSKLFTNTSSVLVKKWLGSFIAWKSTLIDFTASIIYDSIINENIFFKGKNLNVLICGGGRKNLSLVKAVKRKLPKYISLNLIDDYKIDGDFIESQAFAYLAIRTVLKKEISYPNTTDVQKPSIGGVLVKNY